MKLPAEVEFIYLLDADSRPAAATLDRLLATLVEQRDVPFAQGLNCGRAPNDATPFQRAYAKSIDFGWWLTIPSSERYGFPFALGHNVLLRRLAIEETGGLPEVVGEDVAWTLAIRTAGWSAGAVVADALADEEPPRDPTRYLERQARWTRSDLDLLLRSRPRLLSLGKRSPTELAFALAWLTQLPTGALAPVAPAAIGLLCAAMGTSATATSTWVALGLLLVAQAGPAMLWTPRVPRASALSTLLCWWPLMLHASSAQLSGLAATLSRRRLEFRATGRDGDSEETRPPLWLAPLLLAGPALALAADPFLAAGLAILGLAFAGAATSHRFPVAAGSAWSLLLLSYVLIAVTAGRPDTALLVLAPLHVAEF